MSRREQQQGIVQFNALGVYRMSVAWALTAGMPAGPVLSARWAPATTTRLMVIHRMRLGIIQSGAGASAGQFLAVQVNVVRGFTVADSGGTAVVPTGNSQKMRTNMGTTLLQDLRITNAAAVLTAGTRVADNVAFLTTMMFSAVTTPAIQAPIYGEFDASAGGSYPLALGNQEGFLVNNVIALAATTSLEAVLDVEWSEVEAF